MSNEDLKKIKNIPNQRRTVNKTGDRCTIDPDQPWERHYWSLKWGVSDKQLIEAIKKTGSRNVRVIEDYLLDKDFIA